MILLYSDAEGNGNIGAVAQFPGSLVKLLDGRLPRRWRRELERRRTNMVAYELLAALVAVTALCPEEISRASVVQFVDSTSALVCVVRVVRGFSVKKEGLGLDCV